MGEETHLLQLLLPHQRTYEFTNGGLAENGENAKW